MKELKIVEFFSGIGSQARALQNIGIKIKVQATCEWDIHASVAYDAMHKGTNILPSISKMPKEIILEKLSHYTLSDDGKSPMKLKTLQGYSDEMLKRIYTSIKRTKNLTDICKIEGRNMPKDTDLLTYSFPCQDLSNVGAFHGYNKGIEEGSGSRSSLLWQVGRILAEMKSCGKSLPRYLIMENVPTLLSKRHINNFNKWINNLKELGYISKYLPVNARNYGIPQNRPRLLMLSVYVGGDKKLAAKVEEFFNSWGENEEYIVKKYEESSYYKKITIENLLRTNETKYENEMFESTPNDTPSRRRIWNENPKIIDESGHLTSEEFIRTITTKQDRHPNSGNIYYNCNKRGKSHFRYLTPRECLLFMGFNDKDYETLIEHNIMNGKRGKLFSKDKIIRMAGNSIPVKMLEGFFYQLYFLEDLLQKSDK